jgi:hypothetical protein
MVFEKFLKTEKGNMKMYFRFSAQEKSFKFEVNKYSCIADWRFRVFYPCRQFHLAWGCEMSRVLYNGTLRMTSFYRYE